MPVQPKEAARVPLELLGVPQVRTADVDAPTLSSAHTYEIGWFDLAFREETRLPRPAQSPRMGLPHTAPTADESTSNVFIKRLAAVLQPTLNSFLSCEGPLNWPHPLLKYQQEGCTALLSHRELLLADDMGLGKTVQAIAALRILFVRQQISSALVVCPASLITQWQREFAKWAPELAVVPITGTGGERASQWRLPAPIKLVSYETLRGDVLDLKESYVRDKSWDTVVLDEAAKIKNRDSGIARACKLLPRKKRWALTGTPLENHLDDVLSILEFLCGEPRDRRVLALKQDELRDTLAQVQLRRKKNDVLVDLPPKRVNEVYLPLLPAQQAAYDKAEQEGIIKLSQSGAPVTITHVLELITRLKQICNRDPLTGQSTKLDDIAQRMTELSAQNQRALVFSQFTGKDCGVRFICEGLAEFAPLCFTGDMPATQRQSCVDTFTSTPRHRVLVLSLRAGGYGLNLQAASYVFHMDRWWNPAVEEQAESRAHRMGQIHPVTVYRYTCLGTIEERIDQTLKEKRKLFKEVVDDVTLDISKALTEAELFGLFGLRPPTRTGTEKRTPETPHFRSITGEEFETWLAGSLRETGFRVIQSGGSHDGGIDITASSQDALGITQKLLIQCKNLASPAGVSIVRELRGAVPDRAGSVTPVVASPSGFTADATAFAERHGITLWGPDDLTRLTRIVDNGNSSDENNRTES